MGCSSGFGYGAGQAGYGDVGGGGGGYGGAGGCGYGSGSNEGLGYASTSSFSAGSGGGRYYASINSVVLVQNSTDMQNNQVTNTSTQSGAGGGVIVFVGVESVILNAYISSNGIQGETNCGGGAGGTIAVSAGSFSGTGRLESMGGSGGYNPYPGGGGGGGIVTLFNPNGQYISNSQQTFAYSGNIITTGGSAFAGAGGGSTGDIFLPSCPPGYGNSPSSDGVCEEPCSMCSICIIGTYSSSYSSNPCTNCNNAPSHSNYISEGSTTANCEFQCEDGYVTNHCYSQFDNFLYVQITVGGFAGTIIGVFFLVFFPLLYYRLKYRHGWFEKSQFQKKKKDNFIDIFFKENVADFFGIQDEVAAQRNLSLDDNTIGNNASNTLPTQYLNGGRSQLRNGMIPRNLVELRKACKLSDQDMAHHACRINMLGSNSPFRSRGCILFSGDYYSMDKDMMCLLRWAVGTSSYPSTLLTSNFAA